MSQSDQSRSSTQRTGRTSSVEDLDLQDDEDQTEDTSSPDLPINEVEEDDMVEVAKSDSSLDLYSYDFAHVEELRRLLVNGKDYTLEEMPRMFQFPDIELMYQQSCHRQPAIYLLPSPEYHWLGQEKAGGVNSGRQLVRPRPSSDIPRSFARFLRKVETLISHAEMIRTLEKLHLHFDKATVVVELRNIYQLLTCSRQNEEKLKELMHKKDEKIEELSAKLRRDPRLIRALLLANAWRKEKDEAEKNNKDAEMALNVIKNDVKNMETKLSNMKKSNSKLRKDLARGAVFEAEMRQMEETALMRENKIEQILTDMKEVKQNAEAEVTEARKKIIEIKRKASRMPMRFLQEVESLKKLLRRRNTRVIELESQIQSLQQSLTLMRVSRDEALRNVKHITGSLRSLKRHVIKLESAVRHVNKRSNALVASNAMNEREKDLLKHQIEVLKDKHNNLKHALDQMTHKNTRLNWEVVTKAIMVRKLEQIPTLRKQLNEKHKDLILSKIECGMVRKDLKFASVQIKQSKIFKEIQQRVVNNTKQLVAKGKMDLNMALRENDVMSKNLQMTEQTLLELKRQLEKAIWDKYDVMNAVTHLQNVCSAHEDTIRIKDAKNDTLIFTIEKLEAVLKQAEVNNFVLRQKNLVCQQNQKHQLELNEMMSQLVSFTQAEKESAVNEGKTCAARVVLLKRRLLECLNEIAGQHKDNSHLNQTIQGHLNSLDIQKKECIKIRAVLEAAKRNEVAMNIKIKMLSQDKIIFGTLLVQKVVENQLLEKKITLLTKIIERGSSRYRDRIYDIKILKLEIKNLRHKLGTKSVIEAANTDLRRELIATERELALEQSKRKAIEELKAPQPHRYVHMKISQPTEYENLLKIHKLQKCLICKIDEVTQKEDIIMTKDKYIAELEEHLARRPGFDIAVQLQDARTSLLQKNKQIKGLLSEINILTFDLSEYKKKSETALADLKNAKEEITKLKRYEMFRPQGPPLRDWIKRVHSSGPGGSRKPGARFPNETYQFRLEPVLPHRHCCHCHGHHQQRLPQLQPQQHHGAVDVWEFKTRLGKIGSRPSTTEYRK